MGHIWRALVPEPRRALEAHFGAVAAELLREMGGRLWRSREAACAALADLLQVLQCPVVKLPNCVALLSECTPFVYMWA